MAFLRRIVQRLVESYQHFSDDDGFQMAAAMAYYVALSFFPLLLVLVAGLGVVLEATAAGHDAQQRMLNAISEQASPELSEQVGRALHGVSARAPAGGPIGFVGLVVAAIVIFSQFDKAFDRIWRVGIDSHEGWLAWFERLLLTRFKALTMLIGVGAFVLTTMIVSMVWTTVQPLIEPAARTAPTLLWGIQLAINVVLNLIAFTAIFRFVPKPQILWRDATHGGIVAAVFWETGRQLLAGYLIRQGFPSAYGVIGSFLAIMLWAYYCMVVIFFGAEYTRVVGDQRSEPTRNSA